MEDYSDGFKSLIFSGAPQSRTGMALDWCTDVRACEGKRNDDDFFDFPRQRQFGSFGLPQLMWAGRIYCGDERYPGHRTIFGSKQINNNILHSVSGHMHLTTSLHLITGGVAGDDFFLCRPHFIQDRHCALGRSLLQPIPWTHTTTESSSIHCACS